MRQSLHAWLEMAIPQMKIVEAASGEEAIALVTASPPDIVLMDISLPGMSGIEATHHIKARIPAAHVVVLTIQEDQAYQLDAAAAGASAFVPKRTMHTELLPALMPLLPTDNDLLRGRSGDEN